MILPGYTWPGNILNVPRQTSVRSGTLIDMGKGFCAPIGVKGQDIGELIMRACRKKVRVVKLITTMAIY
jgi:hypothetical protein